MEAEREYTNGRIRVRPEQIDYLDELLHQAWIEVSQARAKVKAAMADDGLIPGTEEGALVTHMNRELRLIKSIQDEVRRTKEDMGRD